MINPAFAGPKLVHNIEYCYPQPKFIDILIEFRMGCPNLKTDTGRQCAARRLYFFRMIQVGA